VYLLGESGAGLLNSNGHQGILPCELSDDLSIAHALAMLSVHLGANQAGLTTYTDQYLRYGDGKHIRPDHRIVLPDSHELLIEVEQTANAKLVPRILESLANKQEFFRSEESREFLPEVRMLLNVRRGREWTRTLTVWQEACNLVAQQQNEALLFRLLAMPLDEFLNAPEWEKTSRRWEEPSAYIPQVERKEPKRPYEGSVSVVYPSRRSAQDDYVILSALLERYNETRLNRLDRQPEFAFLDLVILIYSASHSELRDFWQGVSFPDASIYEKTAEVFPYGAESQSRERHHDRPPDAAGDQPVPGLSRLAVRWIAAGGSHCGRMVWYGTLWGPCEEGWLLEFFPG
jgi:hypothetical protein